MSSSVILISYYYYYSFCVCGGDNVWEVFHCIRHGIRCKTVLLPLKSLHLPLYLTSLTSLFWGWGGAEVGVSGWVGWQISYDLFVYWTSSSKNLGQNYVHFALNLPIVR